MKENIYKQIIEEKAWCSTHPTGYIGRDQTGRWFKQCRHGYRKIKQGEKPNCEIIIEKGGEKTIKVQITTNYLNLKDI